MITSAAKLRRHAEAKRRQLTFSLDDGGIVGGSPKSCCCWILGYPDRVADALDHYWVSSRTREGSRIKSCKSCNTCNNMVTLTEFDMEGFRSAFLATVEDLCPFVRWTAMMEDV